MEHLRENEALDAELVQRAQEGDKTAVEALVLRHQPWLLHIAQRMLWHRADAEDATQEILVKALTHLGDFHGRSGFRTWLYRIATNHLLDRCRASKDFQQVARGLDEMPDEVLTDARAAGVERALLVEEAKIACTTGILLCLKPRQRLVFILGEILGVSDALGAAVLDTSAANFRQILSRSRRQLYDFLHRQCGLVNQGNSCRCERKACGFIARGWVQTERLQFVDTRIVEIGRLAPDRIRELQDLDQRHAQIFRQQPLLKVRDQAARLKDLLQRSPISNGMGLKP